MLFKNCIVLVASCDSSLTTKAEIFECLGMSKRLVNCASKEINSKRSTTSGFGKRQESDMFGHIIGVTKENQLP